MWTRYPASTSKLMTTYVTLQAVKSGRITMDTLLTVSPNAVAQTPSKMGFRAGITVTVNPTFKFTSSTPSADLDAAFVRCV